MANSFILLGNCSKAISVDNWNNLPVAEPAALNDAFVPY